MTTPTQRPPLKERSPWLWGCQTVFLSFVALCVLIIIVNILYNKFDGFRMYHGEVEIEPYMKFENEAYGGYYYARCYRKAIDIEKHNLKKNLVFFQSVPPRNSQLGYWTELHKHKTDYHSDGGALYFDDCEHYEVMYMENHPEYFSTFRTWAYKHDDVLPKYIKNFDDSLMTISFQYENFDVFAWQKFIDIVKYERNLKIPNRIYKLKNPQTDSIECVIETKRFDKRIGFKMEIL